MNVKGVAITSFAKFILGSDIFDRVKGAVIRQDDTTLSGAEKKAAVLEEIKTIGMEIAGWAINLAIELAVAYLRTAVSKK